MMMPFRTCAALVLVLTGAMTWLGLVSSPALARTAKPPLHGQHWMAITGKPLAATVGAMMFQKGGNAVDASCAMLAAVSTMWDVLSWGGETQALIYHPGTGKVIAVNALGVAPTGATPEFYRKKGMKYPPETGPLAAVTPGTPGGLMVMRVRDAQSRGRPRTCHRVGRRLSDRAGNGGPHRAREADA
jgi:gamma-glutamyltranspeptidase/glutathione hydrolase